MENNIQSNSIKTIWKTTAHWNSFTKTIFFDIEFCGLFNNTIEEKAFNPSWRLYAQI